MRILLTTLSLLLLINNVRSQTLTPEILWQLARVSDPEVSPDGKTVIYNVRTFNTQENKGQSDIYVVPADGGTPKPLIATSADEGSARWRPDGKVIGFIANDDAGNSQLWEVNADGSNRRQVTKVTGGINQFGYSPTLGNIWYTSNVKLDKTVAEIYPDLPKADGARIIDELMFRHWNAWGDYKYSHVFIAGYNDGNISDAKDLMQGERWDSPLQPFGGDEQISFSSDGKLLAYTSKKLAGTAAAQSTNSDIYLYDIATGKTKNVTEGMNGYDQNPVFSPDSKTMLFLSMETAGYESDRNRLFSYDLTTQQKKELLTGFDYPVDKAAWTADGKQIWFLAGINATHQLFVYETGKSTYRKVTDVQADLGEISMAGPSKAPVMVVTRTDMTNPADVYRADAKGNLTQLTRQNEQIWGGLKKSKVEKRMITTSDGKKMLTWVIYPPDFDPNKKYPALLFCQGGPQSTVSQTFSYRWNFSLISASGYIVVAPNRRGLPSFGEEWNDQIAGDWGGQAMKDLLTAIDTVSAEKFVDKNRLGAVGASFGGFSVYWLAGHHNKRFKAFISHCGVFNLESEYAATEEIFFAHHDMGGNYWDNPKPQSFGAFSPHLFVNKWDTPILVIHNEKDFRVPLNQGMEAFTAAQLRGVPSKFLYFPDEGHHVLKPQNSILWNRVFTSWLDKYLK